MSNWAIVGIIIVVLLITSPGRRVLLIAFGIIYIPLQHLFMWLQKINLSLKDKDPLSYYLSCIIIYPLYAIIIPLSKLYETFSESSH
jgi:hypothetical protein